MPELHSANTHGILFLLGENCQKSCRLAVLPNGYTLLQALCTRAGEEVLDASQYYK